MKDTTVTRTPAPQAWSIVASLIQRRLKGITIGLPIISAPRAYAYLHDRKNCRRELGRR